MALERKTLLDQVEIRRDGTLQVRLVKAIVDGETILAREFHRTVLEPGAAADALLATLNAHLGQMGEAAVADEEWDRIRRIAALEHTPEAVAAYREKTAALAAAREGQAAELQAP
jgi:hypothetical protein